MTDRAGLEEFIVKFDEAQPVDLVIANAGVTEGTSGTSRDIVAATRTLFAINVDGVFNTILPLIPKMKQRGSGQIAIMSSISGYGGIPSLTAYSATKSAVKAYGEGLRGLLYRDGIAVNVICPGFVESPMTDIEKKNGHKLPFMVPMRVAVKAIVNGLQKNQAVITFPFSMFYMSWLLLSALPPVARDAIAKARLIGMIAYFGKRKPQKKE